MELAAQVGGHRAASKIRVEEADHVGCRADRQKPAIRHVAMKPTNDDGQHERVPREVEQRVRDHQGEEQTEVGVVQGISKRGKRHTAQDQREDRRRQHRGRHGADPRAFMAELSAFTVRRLQRKRSRLASRISILPFPSPTHSAAPRATATGVPALLRVTISAAPASSSASAITVDVNGRPYVPSGRDSRSAAATRPRQGRR